MLAKILNPPSSSPKSSESISAFKSTENSENPNGTYQTHQIFKVYSISMHASEHFYLFRKREKQYCSIYICSYGFLAKRRSTWDLLRILFFQSLSKHSRKPAPF